MKLTHTDFTEVTRVILIEEDSVVMLTSSITTSTRVTTVLSDTTVTGRYVTALFPVFRETGWHFKICLLFLF
jgi:hypothetical protein